MVRIDGNHYTSVAFLSFSRSYPISRSTDLYRDTFRAGADPGTILSVLVAQLVDRLGGDGFWNGDYGWGVRVRRHFGARGMSSVRYGTRLGDLKENWFLLFSN